MTFRKNGSPMFYKLIEQMADIHDRKSHDYASNQSPFANYQFAGQLSKLFNNPDDAGFIGRIGEKLYRLANLENSNKAPSNESIEDTEVDLCVIMALWVASRRERRSGPQESNQSNYRPETTEAEAKKLYEKTIIQKDHGGQDIPFPTQVNPLLGGIKAQLHSLSNIELNQVYSYIKNTFKV